jgi:S-adenosylmethionine:tRNA ribosyltransferase-isomerase
MLVSDFDYDLPSSLIAQEPSPSRVGSRLLVVDRAARTFADSTFNRLADFVSPGDVVVVNNTRVFPARLIGTVIKTKGGEVNAPGKIEVFLIKQVGTLMWEALVKPGRSLRPGTHIEFTANRSLDNERGSAQSLVCEIVERLPDGRRIVCFETASDELDTLVDKLGRTPVPPYIKRERDSDLDADRYQTVYAKMRGSIAAPTAGLHFSEELLDELRRRGTEIVEITLHVGYGTFQPVRVDRVELHKVEPERYMIGEEAARSLNTAFAEGRRIIAVGTTTTRALESAAKPFSASDSPASSSEMCWIAADSVETELFIHPGFQFKVLEGLITNFHLPRSSLLMLVSAFGGRELVLAAYRHAVEEGYRFYSYGDAMLIL